MKFNVSKEEFKKSVNSSKQKQWFEHELETFVNQKESHMIFDIPTNKMKNLLDNKEHGQWLHDELFKHNIYPEDDIDAPDSPIAWVVMNMSNDDEPMLEGVFANRVDAKEYTEQSNRRLVFEAVPWNPTEE